MGRYAAAEAGGSLHPAVLLLTTSVVVVGCLGHGGRAGGGASPATAAPQLAAGPPSNAGLAALPGLSLNGTDITVSGLSAGGFMAVQFHVAYSSTVRGAGIIAGGPYWCANDNIGTATHACMVAPAKIDPQSLAFYTRQAERVASIDHTTGLKAARVYIFAGLNDTVVVPGVADQLAKYYSIFTAPEGITQIRNISAEHAMPTLGYGNPCGFKGAPYINDCGYDAAFGLLRHLWPDVSRALPRTAVAANLVKYEQSPFFIGPPAAHGMDESGYVYIPTKCRQGPHSSCGGDRCNAGGSVTCRLHVAFHGCEQGIGSVGDVYVRHGGYNDHAELNNIVVLYPQAIATALNPNGCFDWWGYTSPAYASKLGLQLAGVHDMVTALTKSP